MDLKFNVISLSFFVCATILKFVNKTFLLKDNTHFQKIKSSAPVYRIQKSLSFTRSSPFFLFIFFIFQQFNAPLSEKFNQTGNLSQLLRADSSCCMLDFVMLNKLAFKCKWCRTKWTMKSLSFMNCLNMMFESLCGA